MAAVEVIVGAALAVAFALVLDASVNGDLATCMTAIMQLALAALLGAYLFYRHWQRTRQEPTDPKVWDGKSFDASGIAPRIEKVRENYLAEKHPPTSHFHRRLFALARHVVSHLAFFRDRTHAKDH